MSRDVILQAITSERERQVSAESYTPTHDDEHTDESLAIAAACYASPREIRVEARGDSSVWFTDPWPWITGHHRGEPINLGTSSMKKGKSRERQLVIAAALIVAELERMARIVEAKR